PRVGRVLVFEHQMVLATLHHLPVLAPAMAMDGVTRMRHGRALDHFPAAENEAAVADAVAIGDHGETGHLLGVAARHGARRGRAQPVDAPAVAFPPEAGHGAAGARGHLAGRGLAGQGYDTVVDNHRAPPRGKSCEAWRDLG